MTDELILYESDSSIHSQYARSVFHECGISYKSIEINLFNLEHLEPWYAQINGKMEIPSFQHYKSDNSSTVSISGCKNIILYSLG